MADNAIAAQATNAPAPAGNTTPTNSVPGAKPGETPQQTQARMFKVKIGDQEREVPESELVRNYQLREASDAKFNEAAKNRQQVEAALALFKDNPKEALRRLGLNPQELASKWAMEQIEDEMLTPEAREARDMKAKLAEFQRKEEETQAAAKQVETQAQVSAYVADVEKKTIEAAKKARLPITGSAGARTAMRYAQYMSQMFDQGYTSVNPDDVTDMVINDYKQDVKELLGSGDDDLIANILGDDIMKKVSGAQLKRIQNNQKGKTKPGEQNIKPNPQGKKQKKKDPTSYFDAVRERLGH